MRQRLLAPDLVFCSPARRTKMTWEAVRQGLASIPRIEYRDEIYEADGSVLLELLRHNGRPDSREILMIGHNPGLTELALFLVNRQSHANQPSDVALATRFPTAGFVMLGLGHQDWQALTPQSARILDFVNPKNLV